MIQSELIIQSRKFLLYLAPTFKRSEDAAEGGCGVPYMLKYEKLFGINVQDLVTVDRILSTPTHVYRKLVVKEQTAILTETSNR